MGSSMNPPMAGHDERRLEGSPRGLVPEVRQRRGRDVPSTRERAGRVLPSTGQDERRLERSPGGRVPEVGPSGGREVPSTRGRAARVRPPTGPRSERVLHTKVGRAATVGTSTDGRGHRRNEGEPDDVDESGRGTDTVSQPSTISLQVGTEEERRKHDDSAEVDDTEALQAGRVEGTSPLHGVHDGDAGEAAEDAEGEESIGGDTRIIHRNIRPESDGSEDVDASRDVSDLKAMLTNMEGRMERMESMLHRFIREYRKDSDEVEGLRCIIHSLQSHIRGKGMPYSVAENKVAPLRSILSDGLHKKCITKYIMDSLVRCCEEGLSVKVLNTFAATVRTIMYSSNASKKKEYQGDNEEMQAANVDMLKKLTYLVVNTIQERKDVGVDVVHSGSRHVRVDKPYWMKSGFVKSKHIVDFYKGKKPARKDGNECDEEGNDMLRYAVVKKVNEYHKLAFNKIRDRVRVEGMKEFWFLFENYSFVHVQHPDSSSPMVDVSEVPLVDVSRLQKKEVPKVLGKIWNATKEVAGKRYVYEVEYQVHVKTRGDDTRDRRSIHRRVDLLGLSVILLMRLTGNSKLHDLLIYHKKVIHVIVTMAETLRTVLDTHLDVMLQQKLDELTAEDDEYHIINIIQDMRPTQAETRRDMLRKHTLVMEEGEYDRLHNPSADSDEEEMPIESEVDELVDDGDEFGDDMRGALEFLMD